MPLARVSVPCNSSLPPAFACTSALFSANLPAAVATSPFVCLSARCRAAAYTITVCSPGAVTVTAPPQQHISTLSLVSTGAPPTNMWGLPGAQGPAVAGTQGMGVKTPPAAAVAAATSGFAGLLHSPKGGMLTNVAFAIMDAGCPAAVPPPGSKVKHPALLPKLHCSSAPLQTQ